MNNQKQLTNYLKIITNYYQNRPLLIANLNNPSDHYNFLSPLQTILNTTPINYNIIDTSNSLFTNPNYIYSMLKHDLSIEEIAWLKYYETIPLLDSKRKKHPTTNSYDRYTFITDTIKESDTPIIIYFITQNQIKSDKQNIELLYSINPTSIIFILTTRSSSELYDLFSRYPINIIHYPKMTILNYLPPLQTHISTNIIKKLSTIIDTQTLPYHETNTLPIDSEGIQGMINDVEADYYHERQQLIALRKTLKKTKYTV